jgi:hypothetical protein
MRIRMQLGFIGVMIFSIVNCTASVGMKKQVDPDHLPPAKLQMIHVLQKLAGEKIQNVISLEFKDGIWTIKTLSPAAAQSLEQTAETAQTASSVAPAQQPLKQTAETEQIVKIYKCDLETQKCVMTGTEKVKGQACPPDLASLRNALRFVAADNPNAVFRGITYQNHTWVIDTLIKVGMERRQGTYVVDKSGSNMLQSGTDSDDV